VSAPSGEIAELAGPDGLAGGACGQPGQGVVDKRGLLVPCSPRVQLADGLLSDLAGALGVPGLQQVIAGLEQVMHVGGLVLRPRLDPPLPVGGGPPVRPCQMLAGFARGPPSQLGSGPPVYEEPLLPAVAADGQEAGGLAGGDLPVKPGGRPE